MVRIEQQYMSVFPDFYKSNRRSGGTLRSNRLTNNSICLLGTASSAS